MIGARSNCLCFFALNSHKIDPKDYILQNGVFLYPDELLREQKILGDDSRETVLAAKHDEAAKKLRKQRQQKVHSEELTTVGRSLQLALDNNWRPTGQIGGIFSDFHRLDLASQKFEEIFKPYPSIKLFRLLTKSDRCAI